MAIDTILCVEDDRLIGEMYVRSLRKAGYDVDWALNGDDALNAVRTKTYDLIMLDIMLPRLRGTEILQTLRSSEQDLIPKSRVIIMTNFDQDEETRISMEHMIDAYLIKAEITPRHLLEVIAQLDAPKQ